MNALPMRAAATASQRTVPSPAQAIAVPTATGVIERLRVRGRAATIQADRLRRSCKSTPFIDLCPVPLGSRRFQEFADMRSPEDFALWLNWFLRHRYPPLTPHYHARE